MDSENVSSTALIIGVAEGRPVSEVNEEVEVVGVVFVLKGKVMAADWVITVESQVVKLVLEENDIVCLTLHLKIARRVIDQLD